MSSPQYAEKNTTFGYEQRSKHATQKGLSTLQPAEQVVCPTDFTDIEREILEFKSEKEFINTENTPTLAAKYISMSEKYDLMMINLQKYVNDRNNRLAELEMENTQLKEQDEYNQGELETYINELDDNEQAMKAMKDEYSRVINDMSEINTDIQSTNNLNYNTMEKQLDYFRVYMVVIAVYSYMIGSYGPETIINNHFRFIIYYPVTILFGVFKMLLNAIII